MKIYMIKNKRTGKLATFTSESNADGEFCVGVAFTIDFDEYDHNVWATNRKEHTARVVVKSMDWFNASFDTPTWSDSFKKAIEADEVEIIGVEV